MVPMMDMLNNVCSEHLAHVCLKHDEDDDMLKMIIKRPCQKGHEVFNCYRYVIMFVFKRNEIIRYHCFQERGLFTCMCVIHINI